MSTSQDVGPLPIFRLVAACCALLLLGLGFALWTDILLLAFVTLLAMLYAGFVKDDANASSNVVDKISVESPSGAVPTAEWPSAMM
jgi:hypothetical protein